MKSSVFNVLALSLVITAGCDSYDPGPKVAEGFFAASDQSVNYPPIATKRKGDAMHAYQVYQYACRETGGTRSYGEGGSVRPYDGGELPLAAASTDAGELRCGIGGRIEAEGDGIRVELEDVNFQPTGASIYLHRVSQEEFLTSMRAMGFLTTVTQQLNSSQENFCQDLFGQPCARLAAAVPTPAR